MTRAALALVPAAATALLALGRPPEAVHALAATMAILVAPGWAWSSGDDILTRLLSTAWRGALLAVTAVALGAVTDLDGWGTLATSAALTAAGQLRTRRASRPLEAPARLALLAVVAGILGLAWGFRVTLTRPLERHVHVDTDAFADGGSLPERAIGFKDARIGESLRLQPRRGEATLVGPMAPGALLVLRAPVGESLEVGGVAARAGQPARGAKVLEVEASPEVSPEEGPVARYLDRGAATLRLTHGLSAAEPLPLRFSAPGASVLYVVPNADALWELHARGELRVVHYYQILNMVEQVRWARELYTGRWVTDVQPPLQAYLAAGPLAITGGDLPTQGMLALWSLLVLGVAAIVAVRAWAPRAPLAAWLLPAATTVSVGRLMLEPSNFGMPDTLHAAALMMALAALRGSAPGGVGFGAAATLAQLLRYPGAGFAAVPALLDRQTTRATRMLAGVLALAAGFAIVGAITGELSGWLRTFAWETGPEHWHGDLDPVTLMRRVPDFVVQLIAYSGGTGLLAALMLPAMPRGARTDVSVVLGAVLFQVALLGTVDHHPSHYFLPGVMLSGVALAVASGSTRRGGWVALSGVVLLITSWVFVPITG